MLEQRREALHDQSPGLDARPLGEIAMVLAGGQIAAAEAARSASVAIARAASAMAITILPVLALYVIFSRQLIRGITSGAVK